MDKLQSIDLNAKKMMDELQRIDLNTKRMNG